MRKAGLPKAASIPALILPVLLGTGVALALLFLAAFLVAALIWGGVLPADNPSLFLTVCAGVCALIGGRAAIGKGSGQAMLTGALTAAVVCVALLLICLAAAGELAFPTQLGAVLLMTMAGGCLSGMFGKKRKKKRKKAS